MITMIVLILVPLALLVWIALSVAETARQTRRIADLAERDHRRPSNQS